MHLEPVSAPVPETATAADILQPRTPIAAPSATSIASMTGYARVSARNGDAPALTLTLKSINHRFLDLQLRLPTGAESAESHIRAELKQQLARGHIECTLTLDRTTRREQGDRRAVPTHFDLNALGTYVANFRAAAALFQLTSEPDLNLAARLPGMLLSAPDPREETAAEEQATLDALLAREVPALLAEAIAQLRTMRLREGAALAAILSEALDRLEGHVTEVAGLRNTVQQAHFDRISERLDALVGRAFDRDRVLAEAALLAERGDVEEELARMRTHVAHFRALLQGGGEAGKKLDFLLQEMNREANTLLSKTAGVTGGSARITECGLAMKAEIEKLREQVQNLE
ncbi:YicC family protein [Acidipila sp. EB88]|nr:YicC family protein [Acidipila sp. EB88]